jgi:TRAP-type mannitol/chloroaromatic compound transport system permease small subunit
LGGADELSCYAFGISTTWALSYALLLRAHIRIDIVYARFAQGTRAILDLVSLLSLGALGAVIAYYGLSVVTRSMELGSKANTPLATPIWVPQLLWWLGLLLFLWTLALLLASSLIAVLQRDYAAVERLAGIPRSTVDAEPSAQSSPEQAT